MILDEIKNKLKIAMKKSQKSHVLAIRNVLEKIKNEEVGNKGDLDENRVILIINKYAKQLKESIEQFKAGGRSDLVEKEAQELAIISEFLPTQMSNEEINTIVVNVIQELNATDMSNMGEVMKKTIEKTQGRADGKIISELVRDYLK